MLIYRPDYAPRERKFGKGEPISEWGAGKIAEKWGDHAAARRYLEMIARHSSEPALRAQAYQELAVCERKIAFWERHANWSAKFAEQALAKIQKMPLAELASLCLPLGDSEEQAQGPKAREKRRLKAKPIQSEAGGAIWLMPPKGAKPMLRKKSA